MASHQQTEFARQDDGTAATEGWSPRNRLFFLIGATTATWGIVAFLIDVWT